MTTLLEAAKQALEALETHVPHYIKDRGYEPITALRAAIEQHEKVEPAEMRWEEIKPGLGRFVPATHPAPAVTTGFVSGGVKQLGDFRPLSYTAPAVPEGWQPTDEELTAIYNKANGIENKNPPITTERIFTAMRAMLAAAPEPKP